MRNNIIVIILSVFVSLGLFLWFFSSKTEDFGLNFFTEMLGVVVTVFIVDRIIKKREETKNIPIKLAIYEDVRLYASRYIKFWTDTYRQSVPEEDPETIEDFFSANGMTKILNNLYMDAEPNVIPSRKWWDWVTQNAKEFKDTGDKIIDRHSSNLEPMVFGYVHQLAESDFNNFLLQIGALRQSDILTNFPRVPILANYSLKPKEEDFKAILGLIDWCNETYAKLNKHSKSIKKVSEYIPFKDKKLPPKSMIPSLVFKEQIENQKKARNQNK